MNIRKLLIFVSISLGIGLLSALLTRNNLNIYEFINVPSFAPPSWLFPLVWTILYILMGVSSYFVSEQLGEYSKQSLFIYYLQLIVNFFWSIIFFNMKNFLFAFIWLILLLVLIIVMIYRFYQTNRLAAYLNIPYLIWVTFAGILNFSIVLLN